MCVCVCVCVPASTRVYSVCGEGGSYSKTSKQPAAIKSHLVTQKLLFILEPSFQLHKTGEDGVINKNSFYQMAGLPLEGQLEWNLYLGQVISILSIFQQIQEAALCSLFYFVTVNGVFEHPSISIEQWLPSILVSLCCRQYTVTSTDHNTDHMAHVIKQPTE